MNQNTTAAREPSRLDKACDDYIADLCAIAPTAATAFGIPGFDDQLENFSPEFFDTLATRTKELYDLARSYQDSGEGDAVDQVTAAALVDRLGVELELHEMGEDERCLNNIASPLQSIRDTLLLMPTETQEDQDNLAARIEKIPAALDGYQQSLLLAASRGHIAPARQIREVITQAKDLTGADSMIQGDAAQQAFGEFASWLETELLPKAPTQDGVGRERYQVFSRQFVGAAVDLDEAYEWATVRLEEITNAQNAIARDLYGDGVDAAGAMKRLDEEERYTLFGTDALKTWMQETADKAIADLGGTHFDIDERIKTIECLIDPAGTGGIFYTPPSEDFSRPGRMWWSVPKGEDTFHTWQELTTVFHEGVPGHHLQLGATMCNSDTLNKWRKLACWNSGHGEGWALYAEALMDELGYHEDPGTRMGMLDAQRLRAARVLIDIGVHLGKTNPDGGQWTYEYADNFFANNVAMAPANRRFELHRYFGWPGQAPSYALGQRLWQQLRADAQALGMDTKTFHAKALAPGSLPMGILRDVVIGTTR
ncbi:hypothetical protein CAQU_00265 [Corynebacterium aquilae DSM 44791]|uniref:DUF885 domain-containing protein n=1 Tax=Corynebacterium aquilae DSM 44791 TaxID=1431546 RepID=A0A1L7CD41_9CORY|nr:hypothetical protein CAQU_00265 [Corynebacterium aquilae DSM 44791]